MTLIEATHVGNGLWVGTIPAPNRYGSMELVLGATAEAPKAEHIAATTASCAAAPWLPSASMTLERATVRQRKTGRPVRFEITAQQRDCLSSTILQTVPVDAVLSAMLQDRSPRR